MCVKTFMCRPNIKVAADDKIDSLRKLFTETKLHHLPVVENDKLVGIVSERDLLNVLSPFLEGPLVTSRDLATLNRKVYQVMTHDPVTLSPDDNIHDALLIFSTNSFSCIPVIDRQQRLVGMLSWRQILSVLARRATVKQLSSVAALS